MQENNGDIFFTFVIKGNLSFILHTDPVAFTSERLALAQTQNTSPKVKPWAKAFH